jgi:hypothetical protein
MADGGDGTVLHFPIPNMVDESPAVLVSPSHANILAEANHLIDGDRATQHGDAYACHLEIARAWSWWKGVEFTPHDVAQMMSLLKKARIKTGAPNKDCYVDDVGYTALSWRFLDVPHT